MAKKHKNLENIPIQWDGDLSHPEAGNQGQSIPASVDLGKWAGEYIPCWTDGDYSINSCQLENMYFEDFDVTDEFGTLNVSDSTYWKESVGRTDIYNYLVEGGTELGPGPRIVYINLSYQAGEDTFRAPYSAYNGYLPYTWGDVSFVQEIADGIGTGSRRAREARLHKFDKDTKKRIIHLICRVKGEKVYDEEKEVGDITIKLDDVDLVINEVLGKIKVEKANVL